jgi:hypothetical protein
MNKLLDNADEMGPFGKILNNAWEKDQSPEFIS